MKADTYWRKLSEVLASNQFKPVDCNNDIVIKLERSLNRLLLLLKKKGKLPAGVYETLRSTGSQPARLYDLTKVHKQNVPLRPVLSLPGSHYESLNKWLAKFFVLVEGANIETNTTITRELITEVELAGDEQLVSRDVTSLYTNVPVADAIEIAVQKVYLQNEPPPLQKEVFKRLLQLAVSNVHFKCGEKDTYEQMVWP